jgi:formiminotetrahydrofolate cyclodeaminase
MSSSSDHPRRGAGFAAGQVAAVAATLVAEVARASSESWAGAPGAAAQATALAERCQGLAEADADVFAAALDALAAGSRDLMMRLEDAADVPLQIAEAAADVAEAAALVAERCDGVLRADAVAAAALAGGAALAAGHLVRANLVVGPDDERLTRARRAADDAQRSALRALDSGA